MNRHLRYLMLSLIVGCGADAVTTDAGGPTDVATSQSAENTVTVCKDGKDNDRDGHTDCADQDCAIFAICAVGPGVDATLLADTEGEDDDTGHDDAQDPSDTTPEDDTSALETDSETETDSEAMEVVAPPMVDESSEDPSQIDPQYQTYLGLGGQNDPLSYGTTTGSYKGIASYSNYVPGDAWGTHGYAPSKYGYEYQCVEYVIRFYVEAIGYSNLIGNGNASTYWKAPKKQTGKALLRYPNGSDGFPAPDDMIVFDAAGSQYGHIAIIRSVTPTQVCIIQQNWTHNAAESNMCLPLEITNGTYTIGNISNSYFVLGWLRRPDYNPECVIDANCAAANVCIGGSCQPEDPQGCTGCGTCETCQVSTCTADSSKDGQNCGAGKVCASGSCICEPEAEQNCVDGNLYHFDSCGVQGPLAQDCASSNPCNMTGCANGQCTTTPLPDGTTCAPGKVCVANACDCEPNSYTECLNGNLVHFDSCGNSGTIAQQCTDQNPCTTDGCSNGSCQNTAVSAGTPCGGGKVCQATQCICKENASTQCASGDVYSFDSCGTQQDKVTECDKGNPCKTYGCSGSACTESNQPNGTFCGSGKECQNGSCETACIDDDGDGYYTNCSPMDCSGHDNDKYIYPGAPEVFDIRDNDCDGNHDEDGLVQYWRYYKPWTANDWEHRYALSSPSGTGWEQDGRWMKIYPTNPCSSSYKPKDGCTIKNGGKEIELWGGFTMVAISQCTGTLGSHHVSLLLPETSNEYSTYSGNQLACTRLGYVPGGGSWTPMSNAAQFYRHESSFTAPGKGDHMWSAVANEGEPYYTTHNQAFHVVFGSPGP